ncbi:MAG: helix-turn-helix domain-containing protein [Armatimonadia bacterium]
MSDHYTADERRAHGKKLARARANVTEALRVASVMAQSAYAEGVPETQIAAELGVDRMTVRKWVGKR